MILQMDRPIRWAIREGTGIVKRPRKEGGRVRSTIVMKRRKKRGSGNWGRMMEGGGEEGFQGEQPPNNQS
jgi:hypothetical protein